MFDAVKFGVGIVTEEAFDTFNTDNMICNYSWKYGTEPKGETEEKNVAEDFMKVLNSEVSLKHLFHVTVIRRFNLPVKIWAVTV